jgi:hypothetical protein
MIHILADWFTTRRSMSAYSGARAAKDSRRGCHAILRGELVQQACFAKVGFVLGRRPLPESFRIMITNQLLAADPSTTFWQTAGSETWRGAF